MTVYERAQEQRRGLVAGDRAVAARLVERYQEVEGELRKSLDALTTLIELRQTNGEEVSVAWLLRQERFARLLDQIGVQLARFGTFAAAETVAAVQKAAEVGGTDAQELIRVGLREIGAEVRFDSLNVAAVENVAASLSPDAPLTKILEEIAEEGQKEAVKKGRTLLINAVATGTNPRQIAPLFMKETGAALTRSITIARTETLRAYRDASLQQYKASNAVESWIWTATLSDRTCAGCLAQHNSIHAKDEPFSAHPRCRCCPRPLVVGAKVRGVSGEDWFAAQDEETHVTVLGREGADLYRSGRVTLADYAYIRLNETWGPSVQVRSNKRALAAAEKRAKAA